MKVLFFVAIVISSVSMTAFASQDNCPLRMQKQILLSDKSPLPENTLGGSKAETTKQPVGVGK